MKKIALIFASSMLLTACSSTSEKTLLTSNSNVQTSVAKRVEYSSWLGRLCHSDCHLEVSVQDEVGLITGQVPSLEAYNALSELTANNPSVKKVFNQTTIGPPVSLSQQSYDSWLTSKVKNALLFTRGLESDPIKVVSQQDVVYLLGKVPASQQKLAIDAARRVGGVKKVVTLMDLPS